jgi:hypothetical protein
MHIGESAAYAVILARKGNGSLGNVDAGRLQATLADNRIMLTFFNDVDVSAKDPWVPAVQFWGTKGFFPSYDARPLEPLDEGTAECWIRGFEALQNDCLDPMALAVEIQKLTDRVGPVDWEGFKRRLAQSATPEAVDKACSAVGTESEGAISRAEVAHVLYELSRGD